MSWLHRLQQRLSITRNEALTLLSLSVFLLVGSAGRYTCRQMRPVSPEYYAEVDSLFAHRSTAVIDPHAGNAPEFRPLDEPPSSGAAPGSDSLVQDPSDIPPPQRADLRSGSKTPPPTSAGSRSKTSPQTDIGSESKTSPQTDVQRESKTSPTIDLNSATTVELEQLPRVGPKIAERIIAFRKAYGPFRNVDELTSVSGIGPKTLDLIRPHAVVNADTAR